MALLFEIWSKILAGNEQLWGGIIGAGIGALAAIVAGLIAAWTTIWAARAGADRANNLTLARDRAARLAEVIAVVQAIRSELEVMWHLSETQIAPEIKRIAPGHPLHARFVIDGAVFPVFEANAATLGLIDDPGVRDSIVRAYAYARSFVDTITLNNGYVAEVDNLTALGAAGHTRQLAWKALETFAPGVVHSYQNLSMQYDDVMTRMAEWLKAKGQ